MNDKATELNGGRITLRPWRLTDASALYALASDPEVAERTGFPVHKSIEDSLRVIQEVFSAPECFAITLKETGEVVGCIQVFVPGDAARSESVYESDLVEVGFWLGRRYWGRGLMSESLSLLYSEQYHSGRFRWRVMDGRTKKDNCAARKVFEKCGFEDWTGSMDEDAHYRKYGIVPDSDCLHGLVGEIGISISI